MSMIDRIAAAIETISDGFALLDAEHRFVLINSKFRQIFGVPDEVLRVGVHYADFIRAVGVSEAVADVDAFVADRMARLAASGEPFRHELVDGRSILVADYRSEDGGVVCVRTDITEQVRRERALAESEERFRRLSEITFEGVLILQGSRIIDHTPWSSSAVTGRRS